LRRHLSESDGGARRGDRLAPYSQIGIEDDSGSRSSRSSSIEMIRRLRKLSAF